MGNAVQAVTNPCCSSSCPGSKEMAPGFPTKEDMPGSYEAPGMAMAEALAEGIGEIPYLDEPEAEATATEHLVLMRSPPPSTNGLPKPRKVSANKLDGLWKDKEHVHMIQSMLLTWGDSTVTKLKRNSEKDTEVTMEFNDSTVVGNLIGNGNTLRWSDGDTWERITFDGAWDDLGHFHIIQDTQLYWSDGSDDTVKLSGWGGISMNFRGTEVQGTLERSGDRVLWSDGDVWIRAGVDGYWQEHCSSNTEQCPKISQIVGLTMVHSTGTQRALQRVGRIGFNITLDNKVHSATLDPVGRHLRWSDGDVWTRMQKPAQNGVK